MVSPWQETRPQYAKGNLLCNKPKEEVDGVLDGVLNGGPYKLVTSVKAGLHTLTPCVYGHTSL